MNKVTLLWIWKLRALHIPRKNQRRRIDGKKEEIDQSKNQEELEQGTPLPSNLVEVETPSETWKTEFENDISALRINGEDVSKMHRAMKDIKKMRMDSDMTLRKMIFIIIALALSILGVGVFALDYLLQFNASKIDTVVDLNLQNLAKNKEGMFRISNKALPLLEMHPNNFRWDKDKRVWTFLISTRKSAKYIPTITCCGPHSF